MGRAQRVVRPERRVPRAVEAARRELEDGARERDGRRGADRPRHGPPGPREEERARRRKEDETRSGVEDDVGRRPEELGDVRDVPLDVPPAADQLDHGGERGDGEEPWGEAGKEADYRGRQAHDGSIDADGKNLAGRCARRPRRKWTYTPRGRS